MSDTKTVYTYAWRALRTIASEYEAITDDDKSKWWLLLSSLIKHKPDVVSKVFQMYATKSLSPRSFWYTRNDIVNGCDEIKHDLVEQKIRNRFITKWIARVTKTTVRKTQPINE